ncbi:MAG: thiamine pyrophosphate-dependent enzyme, partial [Myxococcota bacterium]
EDEITCSAVLDDDVPAAADPAETRLAIALAALERGPVHLNIPLRKPLDPPQARSRPEPETRRVFASQPTLSPAALDRLRRSAEQAKRPVIIDGPSFAPWDSQRSSAAAALAEATGWPLVADVLSTSRTHAASVPHADLLLRSERVRQALRPDFALWFGRAPISKWVLTWLAESGATAFAINPAAQWTDPSHTVAAVMQGRAEGVLALRDELPRASTAWQAAWRTTSSALQPVVASATTPMDWDGAVVRHALQAWKGRWAFVGNSLSIRDADALLHRSQARMLCNRGANGIDGTIATAWGHAWAHDEPGLVVLGDVTFEHDVGSLHQLPYDRPLTIVVVDNGGGRIFEQLPIRSQPGFREVFVTPSERSAVKTGQAAGLEAQDLQGREALQAAIAEAAGSRRPRVIRVQVDAEHSRQRRAAMVADCVAATEDALS